MKCFDFAKADMDTTLLFGDIDVFIHMCEISKCCARSVAMFMKVYIVIIIF